MDKLITHIGTTTSVVTSSMDDDWVQIIRTSLLGNDTMHRIVETSTHAVTIDSWLTSDVALRFNAWQLEWQQDINALKLVTNYQRKHIDYQSVYNAFLLGALTEDEFEQESDSYISESRLVPGESIAPLLERLDRLLDFKLNNAELAEYLEVEPQSIENALNLLENRANSDQIRSNNKVTLNSNN